MIVTVDLNDLDKIKRPDLWKPVVKGGRLSFKERELPFKGKWPYMANGICEICWSTPPGTHNRGVFAGCPFPEVRT